MTEEELLLYFYEIGFEKYLNKLAQKLTNKKVIIYGCGLAFQTMLKYFDFSNFNIIGIYDSRFETNPQKDFQNFKVLTKNDFNNVDYILLSTWNSIDITHSLQDYKVKIKPLINKKFKDVLKEIWEG